MGANSVTDFAQAAAVSMADVLRAAGDEPYPHWSAPVGEGRLLGMHRRLSDGCFVLTAWRRIDGDRPDLDDVQGETLLRKTFEARGQAGWVGGMSSDRGFSLNLPFYAVPDAQALQTSAEHLLRELDSLGQGEGAGVMPAVAGDARNVLGEANDAERRFARLAHACGKEALMPAQRSFELLFDDLPVRISLHPAHRLIVADFFLFDAIGLLGGLRRAVIRTALSLNQAALSGQPFAIGLDRRDFFASTGCAALASLEGEAWPCWLGYQVEQAMAVRGLIRHVALDGAELFDVRPEYPSFISPMDLA